MAQASRYTRFAVPLNSIAFSDRPSRWAAFRAISKCSRIVFSVIVIPPKAQPGIRGPDRRRDDNFIGSCESAGLRASGMRDPECGRHWPDKATTRDAGIAGAPDLFSPSGPPCYRAEPRQLGDAMGFVFFIIGVRVEIALLVLLPFFIAMLGTAVAIGLVIALPLVGAVLILIGIVQGDPEGRRSRDHRAISCSPLIGTPQPRNPCADPFRPVIGARRRPPCGAATVRFAADSLLEGDGFETSGSAQARTTPGSASCAPPGQS